MKRNAEHSKSIISGNISYYDNIAGQYEDILDDDHKNIYIRNRVARFFMSKIKYGNILDFGSGTGLDLGWLLQQGYHISCCEPSESMRRIAIERSRVEFPGSSILFLEGDQSDFRTWNAEFPFRQKLDAVLANFAVVNCIPDIRQLFEKLALVTSPGGMIVALLLDGSLLKKFRTHFKGTIDFLITGSPLGFHVDFNGQRQWVYLYSIAEIRKAAMNHFDLVYHEQWHGFGFSLIHLVKK